MSGKARQYRGSATGGSSLRLALLGVLLTLAVMATGCQSVLKDILSGDTCGDHHVCGRHAAAAGLGAATLGAAGAYLQRKEDSSTEPWPWENDDAEFDAELDEMVGDKATSTGVKSAEPPAKPTGEGPSEPADQAFERLIEEDKKPPGKEQSDPGVGEEGETRPEQESKPPADENKEEPDRSKDQKAEKPQDKEAQKPQDADKEKVKSPAADYVPLTTVGDVTILMDPKTHKISVSNGTYIGGKDQNGYWITDGGNVVMYNNETGKATVSGGQFTATREGTTYTVTADNKILSYDQKGSMTVSDGHFTASQSGTTYSVTKDNKILEYDHMTGGFTVSDGRFTATHEGTVYSVTKGDKVMSYDQASGNVKISDGHFTATHEGTVYSVTKDNKILEFNQASGNIKVSDGQFTATREGTVYSVTKDSKILEFNQGSGDFKVTDGHYVLEHEGSITAFTKDNVAVEYDKDLHMVAVTTKGQRSDLTLALGRSGQYGVDATVQGSIDGTPTTFGVTAIRYNLPETGGQGFAGGLRLEQKDFTFSAQYLKEGEDKSFGFDFRKDDWCAGFSKSEEMKQYYLGHRGVKITHEDGLGRTLSTGGYTHRF